jgi:hypothetical protein
MDFGLGKEQKQLQNVPGLCREQVTPLAAEIRMMEIGERTLS